MPLLFSSEIFMEGLFKAKNYWTGLRMPLKISLSVNIRLFSYLRTDFLNTGMNRLQKCLAAKLAVKKCTIIAFERLLKKNGLQITLDKKPGNWKGDL